MGSDLKKNKSIIVLSFFLIVTFLYYFFDLQNFITFESVKLYQAILIKFFEDNPHLFLFFYFITYVILTSFSLPGATVLTIVGGGIFGIFVGTIVVSFASSIGATFAMLISRYLARKWVQKKFSKEMQKINHRINMEGVYYLFFLRLLPLIPFFVVNLVMGLTSVRTVTFFWVSQLGMLPATIVYVNAGLQLNNLNSISDVYSPEFLISFLILAMFPFLVKKFYPK